MAGSIKCIIIRDEGGCRYSSEAKARLIFRRDPYSDSVHPPRHTPPIAERKRTNGHTTDTEVRSAHNGLRLGPTLPSAADRQLALEQAQEDRQRAQKATRKEAFEKASDLVPKSGGKEGKMDEKRATNAENRAQRDKEVGGLEVDEGTLMGDSSGFAAA